MNDLIRNKRGDIPVTILVIGVFVVCILAILSFLYSNFLLSKSFVSLEVMEKANVEIERGNLESYKDEYNVTKFSPEFGRDWFKERKVFEVQYFGTS